MRLYCYSKKQKLFSPKRLVGVDTMTDPDSPPEFFDDLQIQQLLGDLNKQKEWENLSSVLHKDKDLLLRNLKEKIKKGRQRAKVLKIIFDFIFEITHNMDDPLGNIRKINSQLVGFVDSWPDSFPQDDATDDTHSTPYPQQWMQEFEGKVPQEILQVIQTTVSFYLTKMNIEPDVQIVAKIKKSLAEMAYAETFDAVIIQSKAEFLIDMAVITKKLRPRL